MTIQIRHETPDDIAAIEAVTIAAFANAPHTSHTEQLIVRALRDRPCMLHRFPDGTTGERVHDAGEPEVEQATSTDGPAAVVDQIAATAAPAATVDEMDAWDDLSRGHDPT